jgi:small subunit ribosomal protein S8
MSLQSTDPIADMLTRIRNAINVGHTEVKMPNSKIKQTVAKELVSAGYLLDAKIEPAKPRDNLIITINEPGTNSAITEIERLSKPGRRVYAAVSDIPKVKSGRGIVIISTSKGVMTGQKAQRARLGGELICKVY